jgi:hypothetical protein
MIPVTVDCMSKNDDWVLAGDACDILPRVTPVALNQKHKQQKELVQELMASMN